MILQLQACPFTDVVFPHLPLSALSSSPFQCALQDDFGEHVNTTAVCISLQRSRGLCVVSLPAEFGTDFLFGNMVFVIDA